MIWIIIGYMFLFIWRPFEIWAVFADLRIERLYMIAAIIATFANSPRLVRNPMNMAICLFAGAIFLSWLVSPWQRTAGSWLAVENWLKIAVFYILVVLNVRSQRDVESLIWGFCGAVGLLMVHSIWEFHNGRYMYAMGVPRMMGINTTFRQPNTFSATLFLAMPSYWVAMRHAPTWQMKAGGIIGLLLVVYCTLRTGSRTSLVGVMVFAVLMLVRSQHRLRVLLVLAVVVPVAWQMTPPRIQSRFQSLFDESVYESEGIGGKTSAETRTEGFYEGWRLFSRYPLTGVGPGAWIPATGWTIESHNLYGQIPGELGMLGLVTFAYLMWCYYQNFRQVRRTYRECGLQHDVLFDISRGIEMAIIIMLVTGTAGHSLFRFNWVWFAAFIVVTAGVVSTKVNRYQESSSNRKHYGEPDFGSL